jgi:hypothetical protein
MPLGSTFAADLLNLSLCGKAIANVADNAAAAPSTATWQALHTADPSSGTQGTAEVALTGYTRASVTRSTTGFVVTQGSSYAGASPVANIDFPNLTSTSTGVATHWSVGLSSASTGGKILASGVITPNINLGQNVTPRLTTASSAQLG